MITIFYDFQKTQQIQTNAYVQLATHVPDYIPLRQYVRRALDDRDHDYTVYVQNRILAEWLRDLRTYPSTLVSWKEIDASEQYKSPNNLSSVPDLSNANQDITDDLIHGDTISSGIQKEQSKIVQPTITIEGYLLGSQVTTLRIVVVNSTPFPINSIRLLAPSLQVTVEWATIESGSSAIHSFQARATKTKGDLEFVEYAYEYVASGQVYQFEDHFEVSVRRLQRNEVDSLFEDML